MIAIVGEALIDLIVGQDGKADASPGGGPFNVARTAGRLGLGPAFVGRLSGDGFGTMLRETLARDGVRIAVPDPVQAPTTLAVVDVDTGGVPTYRFYLSGTSGAELDRATLSAALPGDLTAVHVGTLGLMMEPIADSVVSVVEDDLPADVLVMTDPNCRPGAIRDERRYRDRMARVLRRSDVVKVSTEDLGYLFPGDPPHAAARSLLAEGPSLVLITDGARPAVALTSDGALEVPVPQTHVVDTIGAGDAFGGAFLSWWAGHDLSAGDLRDTERVRQAVEAAVDVSAMTCTRAGAEPPWAAELAGRPGWEWLA